MAMNLRGYTREPWTIRYSMIAFVLALRCSKVFYLSLASILVTLLSCLLSFKTNQAAWHWMCSTLSLLALVRGSHVGEAYSAMRWTRYIYPLSFTFVGICTGFSSGTCRCYWLFLLWCRYVCFSLGWVLHRFLLSATFRYFERLVVDVVGFLDDCVC